MTDLHANVVAINLGKCVYYARCERYGLESVHWDALEPDVKRVYIERAQEVLDVMRPARSDLSAHLFGTAVAMARTYATGLKRSDGVIGQIEPKGAA